MHQMFCLVMQHSFSECIVCQGKTLLPQRKLGMMLKTKCRITVNSLMVQLANANLLSWSSIQYNLLEVKHIEK